jgi:predicted dehydrogenase
MKTAAGSLGAIALMPDFLEAAPLRLADKVPVAVIGVGKQGRAILTELQKIEGARVAAICDSDQGRLTAGLRRTSGAEGFADYRQLLDKKKEVQAIVIATPTHLHKDIALAATQAGRHVYCEAPLASTIEDCRAIADGVRAGGGSSNVFAVGLQGRSNPIYTLARSFFRSDSVRELISMRAQNSQKNSWRVPASGEAQEKAFNWHLDPEVSIGMAGELGTHQFDVFHFYLGRYPTSVRGGGSIRLYNDGRKLADTIFLEFRFADGAELSYQATLASSFEGRYEVFQGSNATIKLAWSHGWMFKEADAPTQGWEVYANRQQFHNDEGITLIADATKLASQGKLKEGVGLPNPSLYYTLADFFKAIAEKKAPACGADEGMRATIVGIKANEAVLKGETVAIDESLLKGA